jgi:phospholipid/cholesterol/gamma-HCH transport system ATP-binding protein
MSTDETPDDADDTGGMPSGDPNLAERGAKPPEDEVIVLRDLRKSYGDKEVLKGISLVAKKNQTTVIIGGSGAGKTTLLRCIVALEKATSGEIWIDGEEISNIPERGLNRVRKKFGMVYQYAALLDSINVLDNVAFPLLEHTKLSKKEREKKVFERLHDLGLEPRDVAAKFPSELSGGMRKRVGIARALMLEPKVLVYDEPTSGLDPLTSRMVDELIEEMRERFGVTSLVISHDIASCFSIAHQAVLIIEGKVVARGTPDELANGGNEVARDFIAKSEVDIARVPRVYKTGVHRPGQAGKDGDKEREEKR